MDELDSSALHKDTKATRDAKQIVAEAKNTGFYLVTPDPSNEICIRYHSRSMLGNEDDIVAATIAARKLLSEKDLLIKRRLRAAEESNTKTGNTHLSRPSERIPKSLCTTLE